VRVSVDGAGVFLGEPWAAQGKVERHFTMMVLFKGSSCKESVFPSPGNSQKLFFILEKKVAFSAAECPADGCAVAPY